MSLPHRSAYFVMSKCVPVSQSVAVIVEHAASGTHVGKLTEVPSSASDGHVIVAVCATCVAVLHITSHDCLVGIDTWDPTAPRSPSGWDVVVRTWPSAQAASPADVSGIRTLSKATAAHEFGVQLPPLKNPSDPHTCSPDVAYPALQVYVHMSVVAPSHIVGEFVMVDPFVQSLGTQPVYVKGYRLDNVDVVSHVTVGVSAAPLLSVPGS